MPPARGDESPRTPYNRWLTEEGGARTNAGSARRKLLQTQHLTPQTQTIRFHEPSTESQSMLCEHGYTAHWDCPECQCDWCGRPHDECPGNCAQSIMYTTPDPEEIGHNVDIPNPSYTTSSNNTSPEHN